MEYLIDLTLMYAISLLAAKSMQRVPFHVGVLAPEFAQELDAYTP